MSITCSGLGVLKPILCIYSSKYSAFPLVYGILNLPVPSLPAFPSPYSSLRHPYKGVEFFLLLLGSLLVCFGLGLFGLVWFFVVIVVVVGWPLLTNWLGWTGFLGGWPFTCVWVFSPQWLPSIVSGLGAI